jgi:hypothetical protein
MPAIETQPFDAEAGADAVVVPALAAVLRAGTVSPGIAGKTMPPKLTHPGGATWTAAGAARASVAGTAVIATGGGGALGGPHAFDAGARAPTGSHASASRQAMTKANRADCNAINLNLSSNLHAQVECLSSQYARSRQNLPTTFRLRSLSAKVTRKAA